MIQIRSVTKSFPGRNGEPVVALDNLELSVKAGEFVMITGPSGSGKSTLLFTVGAMLAPTRGEIVLGGTSIYALSAGARAKLRRERIGFVFQTFNLIPYLSCLDNVALPSSFAGGSRRSSRRRAGEMLERLGLGHRLSHRPSELSVGERQRVALCRSAINNPEVLLADEPTGNLDHEMTDQVMQMLHELNRAGQTVVMATHEERLAEMGTRKLSLRDGRVEEDRPSSPAEAPE